MNLYKPSELKAFLAEIDAAPMKFLSQNFLIDGNIVRKIVKFADVKNGDSVLEIGPGPGVLTEELLAQGATVTAVEKDRKFAAALIRLQTSDQRLHVFEDDILKWDGMKNLNAGTKLIANLPYNITTPILTHFLPHREYFQSITVMVQKEVGERLVAKPGSKAYGSLSVFVQFYSDPVKGFIVEPTCFYPAPKVQSAVVQFRLKTPPIPSDEQFFEMTRRAFGQRRKMVRSTLKDHYPLEKVEEGLNKIGKGLKVRPEELSLAEFLVLFKEINQQ
ncbi:MAG: 16S rRNA (adenine(1518)-N(6)/adenine(1519)-N(6))-dimethyltransferase RsmA [Rhabdochlamydiaceae bacterium]|jgi:16S rRNA (adenine1518-N6/adenine1519-N6)-dimethyltransferase